MSFKDKTLESLLDLDGVRYIIDEKLGLWVKFDVKKTEKSETRPQGIRYSLTLHDRYNTRIMGFDNAHAVSSGKKGSAKTYDHWHRDQHDVGLKYHFKSAGKLIEDFWKEVEKKLNERA
jgi:hypothetical protein